MVIARGDMAKRCVLCPKTPIKQFVHWKIIENDFPYDRIAARHHMIIPIRHVAGDGLSAEELRELEDIKRAYINDAYDYILEAVPRIKSIPAHFHLHLITQRRE